MAITPHDASWPKPAENPIIVKNCKTPPNLLDFAFLQSQDPGGTGLRPNHSTRAIVLKCVTYSWYSLLPVVQILILMTAEIK